MFNLDIVTFQKFVMQASLPLSTIHAAVLEFLHGCDDLVGFGAQAIAWQEWAAMTIEAEDDETEFE